VVQVLRFSGVAVSHAGLVRPGNEDSGFLGSSCMLVADGVGGAAAGEIASATAAYVVSALALNDPHAEPLAMLQRGVHLAQEQVAAGVRQDVSRTGMATTLTAVATDGENFALAHIGDSRGYVFRGGLTRVTADHTYVQRLVDEGNLGEDEVAAHPWRHVVMRSINGEPAEAADVTPLRLVLGDRVLLASDGLTDMVPESRIEAILAEHDDDAPAADALLDAALAAGGHDNVTCLVATVIDGTEALADLLVGAGRDPRNVVDAAAVRMPRSA
jgi:serine/threonine protein phosphatase PrpC